MFNLRKKIFVNFEVKEQPWGGGNQFLKGLIRHFIDLNRYTTDFNRANALLFNSHHNVEFLDSNIESLDKIRVVHRVDGPISRYRGSDQDIDVRIFNNNNKFADITIFQSHWSLQETLKMGFQPKNPKVIYNFADPKIFNPKWNISKPEIDGPLKIVGTSWSNNPNKGLDTYKWIDDNIDHKKFRFTFYGNIKGDFKNISINSPLSSYDLSDVLKKHDVYLAPSKHDPCSNALIEALSVGLPVIYRESGGHPELVKSGGLGFCENDQIPELLQIIEDNYAIFVENIDPPKADLIVRKYLEYLLG